MPSLSGRFPSSSPTSFSCRAGGMQLLPLEEVVPHPQSDDLRAPLPFRGELLQGHARRTEVLLSGVDSAVELGHRPAELPGSLGDGPPSETITSRSSTLSPYGEPGVPLHPWVGIVDLPPEGVSYDGLKVLLVELLPFSALTPPPFTLHSHPVLDDDVNFLPIPSAPPPPVHHPP